MALGAGRKGLASELVDEFGYLKGEMPTGEYYTKSQTDNKFETKTHAGNTYQKKTLELPLETLMGSKLTVEDSLDALNEIQKTRQPKTLEVPIEMLSGSKLTVESALQGLNDVVKIIDGSDNITSDYSINTSRTILKKVGNVVYLDLRIEDVTASAWSTLAIIPEGFRPSIDINFASPVGKQSVVSSAGIVSCNDVFNSGNVTLHTSWLI